MASSPRLAGRTAIVTGSGRNIGRAIALAFAREGANVIVNGHRDKAAVDAVVAEIGKLGARALGVMGDVGDPAAIESMVRQATDAFGGVDIAVSNVSVRLKQPFLDITIDQWKSTLNSNLDSSFYMARCVLPGMKTRGFGRLIHISGVDGFAGHVHDRVHNIVCKAGVHAMAKALSTEFAPYGITANTVSPGAIDTERDWTQYAPREQWLAERNKSIPVRHIGRVEDIAEACVYLAADSGTFITGQVLHLNGGQYMY